VYRVRFIIAVLRISALVILVWRLLGLRRVPLLPVRLVLRRVLPLVLMTGRWILTLFLVTGRRVLRVLRVLLILLRLLRLLRLVLLLDRGSACMREKGMAGMAVLAVGSVAGMA